MSKAPAKILRCDALMHAMNPGKEQKVRELLMAWKTDAISIAITQWRLFYETGAFDKNARISNAIQPVTGGQWRLGTAHRQMVQQQLVGMQQGWLGIVANQFKRYVRYSSLAEPIKHALLTINQQQAWLEPGVVKMKSGAIISPELRKLARVIFRHASGVHTKPQFDLIGMTIDVRGAKVQKSKQAKHFNYLIRFSTQTPNACITIPLVNNPHYENRPGKKLDTIQVSLDPVTQHIRFGLLTNVKKEFAESKAVYQTQAIPESTLCLDFGLSVLLANQDGDLLGQKWLARLTHYDQRLARLVLHLSRSGQKLNFSQRYRDTVRSLRAYIKSEIGRVMNRLVVLKKPQEIVVENLHFQSPDLSRRMNRLVQNCGRKTFKDKLKALNEEFGITITEVNAAYTSQLCSKAGCGFVHKSNRQTRDSFKCLHCGTVLHADVNASRSIHVQRLRYGLEGGVKLSRGKIFQDLQNRFLELNPNGQDFLKRFTGPLIKAANSAGFPKIAQPTRTIPEPQVKPQTLLVDKG